MLSIKCTRADGDGRAYEMTDSITGMKCSLEERGTIHVEALKAWIAANTDILKARIERDLSFVGDLPKNDAA